MKRRRNEFGGSIIGVSGVPARERQKVQSQKVRENS